MRTRMYGGVRGRKTKIGGKPTFVFLLLDFVKLCLSIVYFVLQGFDAYLLYKPDFGLISYSSGVELRSSERVVSTIVHRMIEK